MFARTLTVLFSLLFAEAVFAQETAPRKLEDRSTLSIRFADLSGQAGSLELVKTTLGIGEGWRPELSFLHPPRAEGGRVTEAVSSQYSRDIFDLLTKTGRVTQIDPRKKITDREIRDAEPPPRVFKEHYEHHYMYLEWVPKIQSNNEVTLFLIKELKPLPGMAPNQTKPSHQRIEVAIPLGSILVLGAVISDEADGALYIEDVEPLGAKTSLENCNAIILVQAR